MAISGSFEVGTVCPDGGRIDLNILVMKDKTGAVEMRFSGPGDRPEERSSLILTADEFDALRRLILLVDRQKENLVSRDAMRSWIYSTIQRDAIRESTRSQTDTVPELAVSGDGSVAAEPIAA